MNTKILIKGEKVHDVGCTLFLMSFADDFEIEKFDAKNIKEDEKQAVMILVESSEDNAAEFFNCIGEDFPPHAKVDSVDKEDYDGGVKSLESFRSGFMAAQQQKFVNVGAGLLDEVKEFRNESGEKQDQTTGTLHDINLKI